MPHLTALSIAFLILLAGCIRDAPHDITVPPHTPRDTLVLETSRGKGWGLMEGGVGSLYVQDTASAFSYAVAYPNGMTILGAASQPVDLANPSLDHIDIVFGERDGSDAFIVDENDNQDFRDDPVRTLNTINWKANDGVPVTFRVQDGDSVYQSNSYLRIGLSSPGPSIGTFEHLTADVTVGSKAHRIGLTASRGGDFT
jgi:hypothetical protein